jgi:transposase
MGRSRGGLTTKVHAVVDANGLPISLCLSEGQAYDGHSAHLMLDSLTPGSILLADRAYDADKLRNAIARKAPSTSRPCLSAPDDQRSAPFSTDTATLSERFFNKLKHFRAVATRYDKRDDNFLASVQLASIRIWLRFNESVT